MVVMGLIDYHKTHTIKTYQELYHIGVTEPTLIPGVTQFSSEPMHVFKFEREEHKLYCGELYNG